MRKVLLIGIVVGLIGILSSPLYAETEAYTLSVTIPALIGINSLESSAQIANNENNPASPQEIKTEEVVRNHETIILNTIVAK